MKSLESVRAKSVERFDPVSVMYWLIHRGSLARLSARANRFVGVIEYQIVKEF
jgi:hypothetical protein